MRLWVGCSLAMLTGCLFYNPAFGDAESATSGASATGGGSTGDEATASSTPTTGAATSGGSGGATSGDSTGVEVTTGATGESTGAPVQPQCLSKVELGQFTAVNDTGVVPSSMGAPCPWQDTEQDCAPLNFGARGFYRLVNDPNAGRNVALQRYSVADIELELEDSGYTVADVIGLRVAFVIWEPLGAPAGEIRFDIGLVGEADQGWFAGDKNGGVAVDNDSSFACRRREAGMCTPWSDPGGPLPTSTTLGELILDAAKAAASDEDQDPAQYHSRITSESLAAAPVVEQWSKGVEPTFTVSLQSPRGVGEGTIGIKMLEGGWSLPTLSVQVCDLWDS